MAYRGITPGRQNAICEKLAHHVARSKRRLDRLGKQLGAEFRPRKWPVSAVTIAKLERDINALPRTTYVIPIGIAKELVKAVNRLRRRQAWLSHRNAALGQQVRTLRYRVGFTTRLATTRDLDELLRFLVARKEKKKGKGDVVNVHAAALGLRSAIKRRWKNPNIFSEIGKVGADARWAAHRTAMRQQIEDLTNSEATDVPSAAHKKG